MQVAAVDAKSRGKGSMYKSESWSNELLLGTVTEWLLEQVELGPIAPEIGMPIYTQYENGGFR